jgi:hypothetical protein
MAAKEVRFSGDARERIFRSVKVTLGPKGRNMGAQMLREVASKTP